MPYIHQGSRSDLESSIKRLADDIEFYYDDNDGGLDGVLNYAVTELVARTMKPKTGWRYFNLHRAYGVFFAAAAEFYRRLVAPYEDRAMRLNGDISAYDAGSDS